MSFRDFITNRWFRRKIAADMERYENIEPPVKPSQRYINKLVRRLLNESTAKNAHRELSLMGPDVVPLLVMALRDRCFQQATWGKFSLMPAPLESALQLLVLHGGEHMLAAATELVDSPQKEVRKTVALHLASTGRADAVTVLSKFLHDEDSYVRSSVRIGVDRALSSGRSEEDFRLKIYDLLLAQCDQEWHSAGNDCPKTLINLDAERAAHDLADPKWFASANRSAWRILEACNEAGILLPESLTRPLLERSLPLATGETCYPHQYLVAGALGALTIAIGERVRPLLESSLNNEQDEIQEAAARGIARLSGSDDPAGFVFSRLDAVGFDGLTDPQKVFYLAFVFDAEVCNGGIMQFFGNSSGDHAAETLDALAELGHPEAEAALRGAMRLVGPLSREADRDMRLSAFENRYDELQAAFEPLEDAYYRTAGRLRKKMILHAARNAEHFRGKAHSD